MGLTLYHDGGLRFLPNGRANDWSFRAPHTLAIAMRMLEAMVADGRKVWPIP